VPGGKVANAAGVGWGKAANERARHQVTGALTNIKLAEQLINKPMPINKQPMPALRRRRRPNP